mgnify:FL=1
MKSSILINPNNLDGIIDTLINFKEEIALNQKIVDNYFIKEEDKQNIISTFLKGITIKDLILTFGYKEETIRELLIQNEIEIIEWINTKPKFIDRKNYWKNRKRK